jgi:aminopeptidase-like protein
LSFNKIFAGFNVTCVGDDRAYSYLPSRNGKTVSDLIAKHVLKWIDPNFTEYSWFDRGSDERQYCSPGVDLPICSILRSKYGNYPEYHTSDDNLTKVVSSKGLYGGYKANQLALNIFENNFKYYATNLCEPKLSKYNLRSSIGAIRFSKNDKIISDILSLCDGKLSILDIAEYLNVPVWDIFGITEILLDKKLIKRLPLF